MEVNINEPIFDQNTRQDLPASMNNQVPPHHSNNFWGKKVTIIILLAVLALAITAAVLFFLNSRKADPKSENVVLTIKGPNELASGNEIEYVINYRNGENADLINISLELFYPANFKFSTSEPASKTTNGNLFDLPVLRQGQDGEVIVRGKLSGRVGDAKELRVRMNYKLTNFSSEFALEQKHSTMLSAPNLVLEITGPIDVTNGQDSNFSVNYSNVSGQDLDNVALRLSYPPGFKFTQSNPPALRDNNFWTLGKLVKDQKGKIDINGSFTGDPNQEKIVSGELGYLINNSLATQITSSVAFKIVPSSLRLTQSASPPDSVKLGNKVSYNLDYGNFGTIGQTNVIITVTLEGPAIDFTQLRVPDALITGNTITWKSVTNKNLSLVSPNQQGEINFDLPLKSTISNNVKNQVIKTSATIYSDQIKTPIRVADNEVKLSSELGMIVSGKYVSGALPMQVGQSTTFAITILLTNLSNDLTDVEVISLVPLPDSAWKNVIIPESEKSNVTFDNNANRIRWKVGNLAAFVGKFTPARTLTFQLEVVPDISNKGQTMPLLRDIQASGRDTFINKDLTSPKIGEYRTSDLDDEQVEAAGDSVQ
jgi:hypothetical protein